SLELTEMYLARLHRYNGVLNNVVTFLDDYGRAEAKRADAEIAAGRYKGPLHGIPWGAKDIISVKGFRTTWGSLAFKEQVFDCLGSDPRQSRSTVVWGQTRYIRPSVQFLKCKRAKCTGSEHSDLRARPHIANPEQINGRASGKLIAQHGSHADAAEPLRSGALPLDRKMGRGSRPAATRDARAGLARGPRGRPCRRDLPRRRRVEDDHR